MLHDLFQNPLKAPFLDLRINLFGLTYILATHDGAAPNLARFSVTFCTFGFQGRWDAGYCWRIHWALTGGVCGADHHSDVRFWRAVS